MDSEDEINEDSWRGVPGSIILINVYDEKNLNAAIIAHGASCAMIKQCLRTSNSYNIGVCLYGTDDNDSSAFNIKNVTEILPFTVPHLENFLKFRNVDISKYPRAAEFRLSDALWHCSKAFANCKKLLSSRTVIILSKLDIPPVESDQKPTFKRVVDLVDSNIEIKVINISENEYEIHQFYKNFLIEANKGKVITLPKHVWEKQEIQQLLHQHAQRHLAVAQLSFQMGDDFLIGVGIYSLLKSQSYNKKMDVDRETNAIITSITKTTKITSTEDEENHDMESKVVPLLKSELLYYQEYGGERVEFTDSEMKRIKNPFGPPMLKLLGFKPKNLLCKEKWFLKPCYFLYPNEKLIDGSTKAFNALHQACIEMNMVAICVLCTRINSKPAIVALAPSSRPLGLDVEIGFDIISIPFAEHLRQVPVEEEAENTDVTDSHKTNIKEILQSLKFDYDPSMFENPKMQCEYRAIEAIALEEEDIEPFNDTTLPDPKVFKTIKSDLFHNLFGPFAVKEPKRPAMSKDSGTSSKIKKDEIDESLLENRLRNKTIALYTVSDLKNILKSRVISDLPALTGLKKNQLVEFVYKYIK